MNASSVPDRLHGSLRFRRDLVCRRLTMGTQSYWVLKDPLSRSLQYVKDDEYAILQLVDGRRTLQQILKACEALFIGKFVSPETLLRFLADAKRRHLITNSAYLGGVPKAPAAKGKVVGARFSQLNLLAIRLPGIRPDRILDVVEPALGPLLSKTACAIYVMLLVVAALIAVTNAVEIADNVETAFANHSAHALVRFLVVMGLIKIIHELAHAIACKSLGGDCRELGVILLMGAPCLYCDVSDAWLMTQRWKRILVSAAGMLAELGIAAVATVIWLWTGDDELRQWWMVVMVVCSVSTIVINGNPLMQFDGYFIFSDLVGIPNLATQSKEALYRITRRWLWAETFSDDDREQVRRQYLLGSFALISGLYRLMLLSIFAIAVYQFTSAISLAIIGFLLAAILARGFVMPIAKAALTPPRYFSQSPRRAMRFALSGGLTLAILSGGFIPLPRTLVTPMTIRPGGAQEIFLTVGGRMTKSVAESSTVRRGDVIAVLDNTVLKEELLEAQSRFEQLSEQKATLLAQRSSDSAITAQLAAVDAAKQSMAERVELLGEEVEKLSLTSPMDGMVFFAPDRLVNPNDESKLESWQQTPLHTVNTGAWIEPGTMVCSVGHPVKRDAILFVDQKSATLIKEGQRVELLRPDMGGNHLRGSIIEVGVSPVVHCPIELTSTGLIPLDASVVSPSLGTPLHTLYQVRVELAAHAEPLPIRSIGLARVRLESASLWSRLSRIFLQSFRL